MEYLNATLSLLVVIYNNMGKADRAPKPSRSGIKKTNEGRKGTPGGGGRRGDKSRT